MMARKAAIGEAKMAYVSKHPAAHRSSRSDCQIRERAIESAKAQPSLGWDLQGSACKVPNDITMADYDLELMFGMRLELFILVVSIGFIAIALLFSRVGFFLLFFLLGRSIGTVKVPLEGPLDSGMSLVRLGNGRFARPDAGDVVRGSPLVEVGVGVGPFNGIGQMGADDVGGLLGPGHVAHTHDLDVARSKFLVDSPNHLGQPTAGEIGLLPSQGSKDAHLIFLVRFVVLAFVSINEASKKRGKRRDDVR